jgi:hypothetical protein
MWSRWPIAVVAVLMLCVSGVAIADDPHDCDGFRSEWSAISRNGTLDQVLLLWARVPLRCPLLRSQINARREELINAPATPPAPGGRGAAVSPTTSTVEVRGYVLSRETTIPGQALAFTIPVFLSQAEAQRFCPSFLARLSFEGRITANTQLRFRYAGRNVEVVPFVWPVTSWENNSAATCSNLVRGYDYARARSFLNAAQSQILARQVNMPLRLTNGPYIVVARRQGGSVVLYDLSEAPDVDYDRWLMATIVGLENENAPRLESGVVAPGWRDRLRYHVFGAAPAMRNALSAFVPNLPVSRAE